MFACLLAQAQTDTIRYVRTTGTYNNDGRSWATAKNSVQDAINDLREYLRLNNLQSGSVYIASGIYVPTESTESSGGSMLNTSFKIYEGIHVYGGFSETSPESRPEERLMQLRNGTTQTWEQNWNNRIAVGSTSPDEVAAMWDFANPTILTGNHSSASVTFTFDEQKGRYNTAFPASSYHVVWFGTNGVIPTTTASLQNHYKGFSIPAWIDGCTIREGNASSRQTAVRDHTAYGGGAYMVANTSLLHCKVEYCNASLRGGGVYMDGGGMLDLCYINTCQASGVGIVQGYGGAVCIDYDGAVRHSYLTQSCARIGGGLSICHVPGEYPWEARGDAEQISPYSPYAAACVISNNTSNAEGGGVYLDEGGTVNHVSIVNNACIGPDVTYYNRRHGRSGGVYVRNNGMMYNSYCWGNTCTANNDIQFAAIKQNHLATDTIFVYHCAFQNHDITDWSGVTKDQVSNLEKQNLPTSQTAIGNYVALQRPTTKAGVIAPADNVMDPSYYYFVRYWHPRATSSIAEKGVQVTDAVQGASQWVQHAHVTYGVVGNTFEPVSSLGALVRDNENIRYAIVAQQSLEGNAQNTANTNKNPIPTIFLDPNFQGCYDADGNLGYYDTDDTFRNTDFLGDSWDRPLRNLGEAVNYFRQYLVEDPSQPMGQRAYYMMPVYDADGNRIGTQRYDFVQILVKPGVLTTAGPGNYLGSEMRTAAVRVLSHMRLYAAYPSNLTDTDTSGRDPRTYTTRITANITGGLGESNFQNNSAHVLAYVNTEFAVVDGFRLYNANSHDIQTTVSVMAGGGVLVNNRTTDVSKRIDMVGNELRNCVLANNFSPKGAGIYVNGEWRKSDGEVCIAGLYVVNCVIRNNTAHEDDHPTAPTTHGIITANGRAFIDLNHCTIVNNVGYPIKTDNAATEGDTEIEYHGFIQLNNSIVFANGDRMLDNRGDLGTTANVTVVNDPNTNITVFGSYNMFDFDVVSTDTNIEPTDDAKLPRGFQTTFNPSADAKTPHGRAFDVVYPCADLALPSGNKMRLASLNAAVSSNKANLTRSIRSERTYPVFENPSRNVGHSADNDKPLYGGIVSYLPMNVNPVVNAANPNDWYRGTYLDVDRSDLQTRDFGGAPDIGAIENHRLPPQGTVIYVTPEGAGKRDGSSWANAIAGNTVYVLDNIDGTELAEGDMRDTVSDRILDSEGNPILTTNSKYNGGFASSNLIYITNKRVTQDKTTVVNNYVDINGNPIVGLDNTNFPAIDSETYANRKTADIAVVDRDTTIYHIQSEYPYGEQSLQSLSFWHSKGNFCPILTGTTPAVAGGNYDSREKLIQGYDEGGQHYPGITIGNNRDERYVSGLQYAVEKASAKGVQVWVGNGIYTDYKGFVMRDSVTVLGGFPASTIAAPGLTERQALMADSSPEGNNSVSIPQSNTAADKNPADYETILQISDISPINADGTFNTEAILFDDKQLWDKVGNARDTVTTLYTRPNVVTLVSSNMTDFTDRISNPTMTGKTTEPWVKSIPEGASESYMTNQGVTNKDNTNNVYQVKATSPASLIGFSLSQTLSDLPVGTYVLKAWMRIRSIKQKNGVRLFATPTVGTPIVSEELWHTHDNNTHSSGSTATVKAYVGDTELPFGADTYGQLWPFQIMFTLTEVCDVTIGVKVDNPTSATCNELYFSNFQLYQVGENDGTYTIYSTALGEPYEVGKDTSAIVPTNTPSAQNRNYEKTTLNNYWDNALRKRVLYMPDVTMPNWSPGRIGNQTTNDSSGDENYEKVAHTYREEGHKSSLDTYAKYIDDPNLQNYKDVVWDGFTIRHGFINYYTMNHGGGAGVTMFNNATLKNCIIYDNINNAGRRGKGGGIFCDGIGATISGCFILNNRVTGSHNQNYGGGIFMNDGTCFNTLIANNYSTQYGGGIGLCIGNFYNNTVAYNVAGNQGGGLSFAVANATSVLFMANSIFYGNNKKALVADVGGSYSVDPFIHCYIQSENGLDNIFTNAINDGKNQFGLNNQLFNNTPLSKANTPFAADYNCPDADFTTSASGAKLTNDFSLFSKDSGGCVNTGTETFEDAVRTALQKKGLTEAQILASNLYHAVDGLELPNNDVAYANRVQDCQVDIGAYEYDGSKDIHPDTITHPGYAIYYITHAGSPNGNASADSPKNAACNMKLQKVLDAAGRYKYSLMTESRYRTARETPVSGQPDKSWMVQVRFVGDSVGSTDPATIPATYSPMRSTNSELVRQGIVEDNTLDYSFIIPHGVQVLGGFSEDFFHYEDAEGNLVSAGTEGATIVDERDPLTFRTVLSGKVTSNTGAAGQVYHVATFTNALFDTHERLYSDENGYTIDNQFEVYTEEADRAVLDGLFIEDGFANSPDENDRIGAAAVVTPFAHIRNCVIQNNEALTYGGGLYLQPGALVSGSIFKNNAAQIGGAVYVNPDPINEYGGRLAHIFTSTISGNTASTAAGGLWFSSESANLRANSIALWGNTSNDYANVAGLFTAIEEDGKTIFPFTYSAVEVRQLEGQGNVELSAVENEGVRWDRQDPFNSILYYPIEMSSSLARTGMPYYELQQYCKTYPTLDTVDIAGVSRLAWQQEGVTRLKPWNDELLVKNNDFIEIGARAINKNYDVQINKKYVLRRLFVMHTAVLGNNSQYARALQDNVLADNKPLREDYSSDEAYEADYQRYEAANIYKQMGSCFINPFLRFSDALKYVARMRKDSVELRDARFEIYLEHGNYEPGNNAYGESLETRTNTFTIPEGVTIVGGIEHETLDAKPNYYCQAGFEDLYSTYAPNPLTDIEVRVYDEQTEKFDDYEVHLKRATLDEIRDARPMSDINQNSVIEPWEFFRQSVLTGEKSTADTKTNTYHVATCFADPEQLGPLPKKYQYANYDAALGRYILSGETDNPDAECEQSKVHRTIIFDGVIVKGGYANNIDPEDADEDNQHPYTKKTYFRGGGIFVDGNWTADFDLNDEQIPSVLDAARHNIPLVIRNCVFQDNMAGNGGAIYSNGDLRIYSSHFTQNYSQGPINENDAKFIPWTAGGCIATNAYCGVVNCLFSNNEAKRGNYPLTPSNPDEVITDAEIRQGWAGVISSSETSTVRAFNCDFVRNKAVAYPAIFNFLPNKYYDGQDHTDEYTGDVTRNFGTHRHAAINCLFWGDKATAAPTDKYPFPHFIFNTGYKQDEVDADQNRGLYFSAYEEGNGKLAQMPDTADHTDYRTAMVTAATLNDFLGTGGLVPTLTDTKGNAFNMNVYLAKENNVTGGPNFVLPSDSAGLDGYMQNADWVISRVNRLTDAGWGYLNQEVSRVVDHWENKLTPNTKYAAEADAQAAGGTADDVYAIYRAEAATFTATPDPAMYNYYSEVHEQEFHQELMPVGNEHYMSYTRVGETDAKEMYRISPNPKLNIDKAYIDIGVYEYQYVQLNLPGNEIDTVWVAPRLRQQGDDGTSWDHPTDNLQDAIDLLLRSANNHDKYVCLIHNEDNPEFSPAYNIDNRLAFLIEIPADGSTILLPDKAQNDIDYGIRSLTFLGGWSDKAQLRDAEQYPTVITMSSSAKKEELNQLVVIENMQRYAMQRTYRADQIVYSDTIIPIVFDGVTFHNTYGVTDEDYHQAEGRLSERGGAAIYYRYQRQFGDTRDASGNYMHVMDSPLYPSTVQTANGTMCDLPKLTLSNCIFFDNGERNSNTALLSPAVRIDDGGGQSLIVNTLFHSNAGSPLYAHETEQTSSLADAGMHNRVTIVNSTFALNGGHLDLSNAESELHNSLIWKDDLINDTTTQLKIGSDEYHKGDKHLGIADKITHNAIYGAALVDAALRNDSLSGDNTDVFLGPNFVNPFEQARMSSEYAMRDFHINPAVQTMNCADTAIYKNRVYGQSAPVHRRPLGIDMTSSAITSVAQDYDLAYKPRLQSSGMERGAYECSAILQRVLYVIPSNTLGGDGSSWRSAFAHGELQNAIDVAAVYTYMYRNVADEQSRRSYVFVKGSADNQTEGNIHFREGVQVFGSIPTSFLDTAYRADNGYTDAECARFTNLVRASVYGVASPATMPTRVQGLRPMDDLAVYDTPALVDGFEVTGNDDYALSPVIAHNDGVIFRNLVIAGNNTTTDQPVVNLRNGLMYNSLVYDNNAHTAVKVGSTGLMLNCTVVGNNEEDVTVDATEAMDGAVMNTITCAATSTARWDNGNHLAFVHCNDKTGMFAPYLTDQNAYTLPAYLTSSPALSFQLHEQSECINAADTLRSAMAVYNIAWGKISDSYIQLSCDRDLLGNPRVLGDRVDIGCFETWRVEKKTMMELTALTNERLPNSGVSPTIERQSFTTNYGGNRYPHQGSVVYLMDSSTVSMQFEESDFVDFRNNPIILRPGFVLLKEGASFYGNGYDLQFNYLAVEKRLRDQQYAMLAFPFDWYAHHITTSDYDQTTDRLNSRLSDIPVITYQYNGIARSVKDYTFRTSESALWSRVDTLHRVATEGYLADYGTAQDTVLRFNSFAANIGEYVYSEDGYDKIVYLQQHDHRDAGTGASLNFTRQEDMGWNMKGLPWLISGYRTDTIPEEYGFQRQMFIPHVLYDLQGAYRSWDRGTTLSMGNAFLTQTATMNTQEEVIFRLPFYGVNTPIARRMVSIRRANSAQSDYVTLIPDTAAPKRVEYRYGRDAVKWAADDNATAAYILDDSRNSRVSLLGAAPIEKDIPLGVYIPAENETTNRKPITRMVSPTSGESQQPSSDLSDPDAVSFALPQPEAFKDYQYVYLIDYEQKRFINLLQQDYTVSLSPGRYDKRFAIRLGKYMLPDTQSGRRYIVFVEHGVLHIRGLVKGDYITVYSPSGQIVTNGYANGTTFSTPLPIQSGYVVKVNDYVQKVI